MSRNSVYNELKTYYLKKARGEQQRKRVIELLDLYKAGKMFSKITAQRELNRYLGRFKSEQERDLHFYKTMTNYLGTVSAVDKRNEKK